jgi:hypothetical protein
MEIWHNNIITENFIVFCEIGECELGSGPSGPRSKVDFPDPEPKTSMQNY